MAGCGDPVPEEVRADFPLPDLVTAEAPVRAALEDRHARAAQDRGNAEAWGALARVLHAHDFDASALEASRRAETLAPADPEWPYLRGVLLRNVDPGAARESLERASLLGVRSPALPIHLGELALEAGDEEEARRHFEAALGGETEPFAQLGLARLTLAAGEVEKARELLAAAAARRPDLREAHLLLATVHRRLGDAEASELASLRAAAIDETTPPPDPLFQRVGEQGVSSRWHTRRGAFHATRGQLDEAEAEYRRALRASPGSATLQAQLGAVLILRSASFDEGLELLREASRSSGGTSLEVQAKLGSALLVGGRLVEASAVLDSVLAELPTHADALVGRAAIHRRLGELEAERAVLERGLAAHPGDLRFRRGLGEVAVLRRDLATAEVMWRRQLEVDPAAHATRYDLAKTLADQGRTDEAATLLERGLDLAPNSSRFALYLAWMLATSPQASVRDPARAEELALRVRGQQPQSAQAADVLAAALAAQGRWEEATASQSEAVRLASRPGDPGAPLRAAYEQRLGLYRAGTPYVQPR